ncbi:MAG TPA: hypothetical protein VLA34_12050, partial [Candidatus Krumholzibacterium sp.]|nr:hypothetical protein [Candidatus Krumholzibacterium sp.]
MNRTFSAMICLMILLLPSHAAADKYAGEFMALGGGARAMALGGAFLAIADDATATFWNPAGIADLYAPGTGRESWEMTFMHSERFGDLIDYNYFSAVFPLRPGESSWGVTLIHMGIDGIPIVPNLIDINGSDGDDRYEPWLGETLDLGTMGFPLESVNDIA